MNFRIYFQADLLIKVIIKLILTNQIIAIKVARVRLNN